MHPKLFGVLPPDLNGCADAPIKVFRQVGPAMTVFDIEKRVAYKCDANMRLLECFDPKVMLYMNQMLQRKSHSCRD